MLRPPHLLALVFVCSIAAPAAARLGPPVEPAPTRSPDLGGIEESSPLDGGQSIVGVFAGYGFGHEINGSLPADIATAGFRWSHAFDNRWLGGYPTFAIEGLPLMVFEQRSRGFGTGFNLLYGHRLAGNGRVLPVIRLGAGSLYSSDRIPEDGGRKRNFSLLVGLGLDVMVSDSRSLSLEYRLHHVSNADTADENPGINAHTVSLGYNFWY